MLSKLQKFAYGIPRLGSSILLDFISLTGGFIYKNFFNLDPVLTGTTIMIAKLVIAFSGFIGGYVSDRTKTKWGRRKPYLFIGAPLLAFSFIMYYLPQYFLNMSDQTVLFLYGAFFLSLFNFTYGILLTPFQAWMPEITEPRERVFISMLENISNFFALAVSVIAGFMIPSVLEGEGIFSLTFLTFLLTVGVLEILLYLPPILFIPREEKHVPLPSLRRALEIVLKNRNYVLWMLAQGISSVGTTILATNVIEYVQTILNVGGFTGQLTFGVVLLVTIMALFPVWGRIIKKKGKRFSFILCMVIMAASLPLTLIIGQVSLPIPQTIMSYIFLILVSSGLSGYHLLPYVVIADLAEEDELKTSEPRAGMYTGFNSIPLNFFQALGGITWGFLMALPKIPGKTYSYGLIYWGPVVSLFLLLSILPILKANIDPPLEEMRKKFGRSSH